MRDAHLGEVKVFSAARLDCGGSPGLRRKPRRGSLQTLMTHKPSACSFCHSPPNERVRRRPLNSPPTSTRSTLAQRHGKKVRLCSQGLHHIKMLIETSDLTN